MEGEWYDSAEVAEISAERRSPFSSQVFPEEKPGISRHYLRAAFLFLGILLALVLLELILRLLPVNEGLHSLSVNEKNPILRYEPNRTSLWSQGWDFRIVNELRTNNYGFVSDIDYDPNDGSNLLAVVGDSFIQADMIPPEDRAAARLAELARGYGRVYAFAEDGAPLSQYLALATYARDHFHPGYLVISIIANDFDSSLMKYNGKPGFHYFVKEDDGISLQRVDYEVGASTKLVRKSALGMYLMKNLDLYLVYRQFQKGFSAAAESEHLSDPNIPVVKDSREAIDAFFSLLHRASGLDSSRILLTIDGFRNQIYTGSIQSAAGSYFDLMRRHFEEKAQRDGYELIDMQPVFEKHYLRHHQKFEFSNDYHWNSLGHEVLAEAIARSSVFQSFLAQSRN